MKIVTLRHAESYGNATGEYGTEQSDSLSKRGVLQAEALAECLEIRAFDKILVSPLLRTLQTIAPSLKVNEVKGEIWPELAEACWHDEREPMAETWKHRAGAIPESYLDVFDFRDGVAIRPDHPETFAMGLRRVESVRLRLLEDLSKENVESVLLVTHGHFIRELFNLMMKPDPFEEYHQDNCGVTELLCQQGSRKFLKMNHRILPGHMA